MNRPAILESVDRLRRIADMLARADDPDERWHADQLQAYLDNAARGVTLEHALGLAGEPRKPRWWTVERLARRDELIRALAARHWPGLKPTPQAAAFAQAMRRHESAYWTEAGRTRPLPPPGLQADLFEIRSLGATPNRRQLQDILG